MKRFSKKPMKVTDAEMHPVELNISFSPVLQVTRVATTRLALD
jgi:hypothetical protein